MTRPPPDYDRLAAEIVAVAKAMNAAGINHGSAGNVSARVPGGMAITPSGLPYDALRPADVVLVGPKGPEPGVGADTGPGAGAEPQSHRGVGADIGPGNGAEPLAQPGAGAEPGARPGAKEVAGAQPDAGPTRRRRPSTEWRLHDAILEARPDIAAVVHAHPPYATTLACLRRDIPAFHYMVAVAGGDSIRCAPYATFGTPALAELAVTALADRTACLLANHGLVALGATPRAALALAIDVEALAAIYWRCLVVGDPVGLSAAQVSDVVARFESYRSSE